MKKILTIAIAFVMVFALASTALAAGWDIVVDEPEIEDIKISIDALGHEEVVNDKFFNPDETKLAVILEKTYPVVMEDKVAALVTVEFPKKDNVSEDMQKYIANGQLKLEIANSNVKFTKAYFGKTDWSGNIVGDKVKAVFGADYGKTLYFIVVGEVEKAKTDAKITATLGVYNEWNKGVFTWEVDDETYTAYHGNQQFTVKTPDGEQVTFFVKGAGVEATEKDAAIDTTKAIKVSYDGTNFYAVSKQVNNELAFGPEGALITEGPEYKKLAAALEEVLDVLGFTYEGAKYMSEEHFEKYFGTIMETEVSKVWPSGYVVELDTVDPSIRPPQTGDNTSVVGFAMIVVALVAAVVLKKVRA